MASLTSVRAALWSGGALCVIAVAATYAALPDFAKFDTATEKTRERESAAV